MLRELVVVVMVKASDGRCLDGAVHAFELAAGPRVLWFCCAVLDAERRSVIIEGVRPDRFALGEGVGNQMCGRSARARCGQIGPIIGQHDADLVRHGFSQTSEEIAGGSAQSFAVKLGEGEFSRPIGGHEEIEPAFRRQHLGNIDVNRRSAQRKKPIGQALIFFLTTRSPSTSESRDVHLPLGSNQWRINGSMTAPDGRAVPGACGLRHPTL